jgi:S1-C subfamily serine protease
MRTSRKLTRSVAAAALVLPLGLMAVAAPAGAATAQLADWYGYPPGYGYGYGYGYGAQPQSVSAGELDTADATASQSTGIVEIGIVIDYGEGEAAGTGLVLDSDGLVVTNHHVVEGATSITVTVPSTGQQYDAEVLGYDARRDVALLQLQDASGLATVSTDTTGVGAGDTVTAVGDAGGNGGSLTAAPGQVTDASTNITVQDDLTGQDRRLARLVEVTSDVVPGDSGGALLDSDSQVVGMNVAASTGATSDQIDGFAIPISRVLDVVDRIEAGDASGTVVLGGAPFLGVQLADGSPTLAGVVDGSPAARLGLTAGDTVTGLDGSSVRSSDELRAAVAAHEPGDTVTVDWTDTSGAAHTGAATLASGPVG